jgi:catechol 2,3-dioxygenase-like lactoylglutathione lyase family enzyme
MFKQIDYTMVVVSDMQRSVEFYRDKLGIPLKFQTPSQQAGRQLLNRI